MSDRIFRALIVTRTSISRRFVRISKTTIRASPKSRYYYYYFYFYFYFFLSCYEKIDAKKKKLLGFRVFV